MIYNCVWGEFVKLIIFSPKFTINIRISNFFSKDQSLQDYSVKMALW